MWQKARLRRGIELVKLANRIEALKMQEDEEGDVPGKRTCLRMLARQRVRPLWHTVSTGLWPRQRIPVLLPKGPVEQLAKGAIFREVVLAKYAR